MERIRKQLATVQTQLREILRARDAALAGEKKQSQDEDAAHTAAEAQLQEESTRQVKGLCDENDSVRKRFDERWKRATQRIEQAVARLRAGAERQAQMQLAPHEDVRKQAHAKAVSDYQANVVAFNKSSTDALARLEQHKKTAEILRARVLDFGRSHAMRLDKIKQNLPTPEVPTPPHDTSGVERRLAQCEQALTTSGPQLRSLIPRSVFYALVLIWLGGIGGVAGGYVPNHPYVLLGLGAFLIFLSIIYSVYHNAKERVYAAGMEMLLLVNSADALIARQHEFLTQHLEKLEHGLTDLEANRIQQICVADEEFEKHALEVRDVTTKAMAGIASRRSSAVARLNQRRKRAQQRLEKRLEQRTADLKSFFATKAAQNSTQHAERIRTISESAKTEVDRLAGEWAKALAGLQAFAQEEQRISRQQCPPWNEVTPATFTLPKKFLEDVCAADVKMNVKALMAQSDAEGPFSIPPAQDLLLPLALTYPLNGSLFIRAGAQKRQQAMNMLFNTVMRLLCSFPPAKAKLVIVDPIGLGQNFAALMHLADYDESLVGGRIWSDGAHIERKLTELTEHMEKVIQKYLRNRYASISEYNAEAGELAEPYRFLVIADFPTGFSELALERLAAIVTSGVRCGVYTLILHDARQRLPACLAETQLRRNGVILLESADGFHIDDESLNRSPVLFEPAPPAPVVDTLINAVGKQCKESSRVEVPFEAVSPKTEKIWCNSAELSVRIPLGKTGADRLQYMELGRGTAQHALIAGKTGSGKSNLFHVIITNAAMWYSPQELEFYLIDFKKGVEFKTYGSNRLAHARVIAIESDREFGLSVLRRIDKELTQRGELFRRARVQDFPSYRKLNHSGMMLPRTLLIIDEFQEFFTSDDEVSQDAALLLDRIVRQGRAFGIHVVLGSQTLGGTYTLAKTTLGQMAVRIALQCNEADSYLILSDDNSAAALLSRPGEAIYNDMSGLVEGNNPFQAVYISKEEQEQALRLLRKKDETTALPAPGAVAIFEGSSPSDLRDNRLLRDLAGRMPPASEFWNRIWLGEANAIKGPTEVEFNAQAGCNLLVVGQRGDAELAMCLSAMLCLSAGNATSRIHMHILDGTAPDSGARDRLAAVAATLTQNIDIVEYRRAPQVIEELAKLVKERQENAEAHAPKHYLMILGLEKFRMLRQDDEYNFSSTEGGGASPAQAFNDILVEGPVNSVHTLLWCDTLGNLNRALSRKALREFETRVLFQMSATDSSELIDNPAANRLGLYNALLYSTQNGAIEKFRPYAVPGTDLIEELSKAVAARGSPVSGSAT